MVKALALLSILISCVATEQQEVAQSDIFTNKWWEMVSGPSIGDIGDACFMLNDVYYHSGGTLISHTEGQEYPYFTYYAWWEYGEEEDSVIVSNEEVWHYTLCFFRKGTGSGVLAFSENELSELLISGEAEVLSKGTSNED